MTFEGNTQPEEQIEYHTSREPDDFRVTNLLRDVAFNNHLTQDGKHISPFDNGKIQVGTDGIVVKLVQGINEEAFKRTLSMAVRATTGVDLSVPQAGEWESCDDAVANGRTWATQNTEPQCGHIKHQFRPGPYSAEGQISYGADWEEMLKGGLQTALETQVIVFAVSGVSRTCTHQLVRTRNASFHQQSQRASFYGNQPEARMPESVWNNERARNAWLQAKFMSDAAYQIACEEGVSYQDARYVLLEGTDNYIMCEYTPREFMNVFAYRGCSMFSWEIVHVMREMRRLLVEAHPFLEPYIKISCEKSGEICERCEGHGKLMLNHENEKLRGIPCPECKGTGGNRKCTFQGWEKVEGQCDFPWAKEENRTFISTAHGIPSRADLEKKNPQCPPECSEMHTFDKGCLQNMAVSPRRMQEGS